MVYLVTTESFPYGFAATQRLRGYAKMIVNSGLKCQVLCLNRCEDSSRPLGNIKTKGMIDGCPFRYMGNSTKWIRNRFLRTIIQALDVVRFIVFSLRHIRNDDKILLYSYNSMLFNAVLIVALIQGVETYYELNEHPSILRSVFNVTGESQHDLKKVYRRLSRLTGVICISPSLKDLVVRSGISESRVSVVNMLVDSTRFTNVERMEVEPYIGYCGAADNNKDGVDRLIQAFAVISNKYPQLKLLIMGPKRSDCKNEELANSLGLCNRVVFYGMVSSDYLPQMLTNAVLLALARPQSIQAQYGFPTKLGEYLLSSNPVVVTAVGDIPLYLKDGENVFLAKPDSIEDFAKKMDEALSHPEKSSIIGLKGRSAAIELFSGEKVRVQLLKALNALS